MLLSKLEQAPAKVLPFWYILVPFLVFVVFCKFFFLWGMMGGNWVTNLLFLPVTALIKHKQLPAIETVLKPSSSNRVQRVSPIYVLILCPTRELASQIAAEATVLLKYHDGIGVQTLVGGTRFKVDQKRLESDPCQVYPPLLIIKYYFKTQAFFIRDYLFLLIIGFWNIKSFDVYICAYADYSSNSWQIVGSCWEQIWLLSSANGIEDAYTWWSRPPVGPRIQERHWENCRLFASTETFLTLLCNCSKRG